MLIRKFLDLSTGHLTPKTRDLFDTAPPCCAYPHPEGYGWFAYVSTDPGEDEAYYPADLIACYRLAREHGCDYILFDCDAEAIDELPYYEDDDPEEPVVDVAYFNNLQADSEGWAIFGLAGSAGQFKLQKCDDSTTFPSDDEAWEFACKKAAEGSPYHRSALEFLKKRSPEEYELICKSKIAGKYVAA